MIHGENDVLIPLDEGRDLFENCGAERKKLVIIPNGGHNDLMVVGVKPYFEALKAFVYIGQ